MPRAGLTRDRIAEEAEVVADEVGLERVTLAAVAERLGVRMPSLYKHIESLEGLRVAVGERAKTELAAEMAAATVGRAGDDALLALAHAVRGWARQHPGRYAATVRAPRDGDTAETAAADSAARVVFDVLRAYGLEGDDAVHATRAFRSALHGFVSLEASGGFGLPTDVDASFEWFVRALASGLDRAAAPAP
ncbi:putative HTH-type transcriptional regulator [Frondihabitans sp. 762G35]|uniref:TetR/AcrR family transcriptional regulator n=1 Tax=Frondihabitans sp. 762G35 TaxID=1446794 RepID=UPI000D214687|nr:TetR/AcrR family transcriptional regulator [Frondihabitans sp. 762G35]ARC55633.1 putative HTH-type transcriptional regulator [Frondihabitans sp. 762G35]